MSCRGLERGGRVAGGRVAVAGFFSSFVMDTIRSD